MSYYPGVGLNRRKSGITDGAGRLSLDLAGLGDDASYVLVSAPFNGGFACSSTIDSAYNVSAGGFTIRGTLSAEAFSASCVQPLKQANGDMLAIGDEDCLYLNVWAPTERDSNANLPVLFLFMEAQTCWVPAVSPLILSWTQAADPPGTTALHWPAKRM